MSERLSLDLDFSWKLGLYAWRDEMVAAHYRIQTSTGQICRREALLSAFLQCIIQCIVKIAK